MNSLVKAFDGLPWIVKLLLALPVLDGICWGIYRICKGHIIAGIIWIFVGMAIFWIIDIISLLVYKNVVVFAK